MSLHRQAPQPALRPFIEWLWYYVDYYPDHDRQHVLPDGTFELVINLQDIPRKLFDSSDPARYRAFKRGWISGAHTQYIVIDALPCSSMIGVHFKPGGAAPFLGLPADELGDQVLELDALWGAGIWDWRDQLMAACGPAAKLRLLEDLLVRKLASAPPSNEAVAWAVSQLGREPQFQKMDEISRQLGISHKHFIEQFKRQVGMTPKKFSRIRRFQQVLSQIQSAGAVKWTDVAGDCGYFDQAHFINEFVAFSGINPSAYLNLRLDGDTMFIRAAV
jgi:AraC-like DNA-binding protein